jgi:hypothetical protein
MSKPESLVAAVVRKTSVDTLPVALRRWQNEFQSLKLERKLDPAG